MINEYCQKKRYLVYQTGSMEQGSEGWSSYYFYCVAQGDTIEEVMVNWKDNVKILYGVDVNPYFENGRWINYYPVVYNELPNNVNGTATILNINR